MRMRTCTSCAALALFVCSLHLSLGCARVRVEAPKEPIKVDITMRLDVYQHVQNDIDAIENIVSGGAGVQPAALGQQGFLGIFMLEAYAQDEVSPVMQEAALRRRDRLDDIKSLLAAGSAGENASGLLSVRDENGVSPAARNLIAAENNDRMTIYKEISAKNGIDVEEVQRMYARRLQNDAPAGAAVEVDDGAGGYAWKKK